MNKAFVREPDPDASPLCPRCGSVGSFVHAETLDHFLTEQIRPRFGSDAWYCGLAACPVIYFSSFGTVAGLHELRQTAWPYDADAPICPCFNFRYQDLLDEVDAPQPLRIRELIAKSRSPDANCRMRAIDGQCCSREIQRLYLRLKNSSGSVQADRPD
jgi:Zinc binding domain